MIFPMRRMLWVVWSAIIPRQCLLNLMVGGRASDVISMTVAAATSLPFCRALWMACKNVSQIQHSSGSSSSRWTYPSPSMRGAGGGAPPSQIPPIASLQPLPHGTEGVDVASWFNGCIALNCRGGFAHPHKHPLPWRCNPNLGSVQRWGVGLRMSPLHTSLPPHSSCCCAVGLGPAPDVRT